MAVLYLTLPTPKGWDRGLRQRLRRLKRELSAEVAAKPRLVAQAVCAALQWLGKELPGFASVLRSTAAEAGVAALRAEGRTNDEKIQKAAVGVVEELLRRGWVQPAQVGQSPSADEPAGAGVGGKKAKEPSKIAIQCYRLHISGYSQTDIADMLTKERKRKVHQGTVSENIKKVREYVEAGNVLPDLPTDSDKPSVRPVAPAKLDYQDNPDGRFRPRKSPLQYDADDE